MRYLGIDLGTKTVGLAISDAKGIIASPLKLIKFQQIEEVIPQLTEIIKEYSIAEIVLGFPKNMDNSLGFAAQRSLDFKQLLEKIINLPIHLVDERLSTVEAENVLIGASVSRKARKEVINQVSACIILDTYLRKVG